HVAALVLERGAGRRGRGRALRPLGALLLARLVELDRGVDRPAVVRRELLPGALDEEPRRRHLVLREAALLVVVLDHPLQPLRRGLVALLLERSVVGGELRVLLQARIALEEREEVVERPEAARAAEPAGEVPLEDALRAVERDARGLLLLRR